MAELRVREYSDADLEHFKRIHAESGLDYAFPELSSPLFIVKTVVERAGVPVMLAAGRIEAETYLVTSGAPLDRWQDMQAAQPYYLSALWSQGIDSTYAVVPNGVNAVFAKRMRMLGWEPARDWCPWTRVTIP